MHPRPPPGPAQPTDQLLQGTPCMVRCARLPGPNDDMQEPGSQFSRIFPPIGSKTCTRHASCITCSGICLASHTH
jgi:hypothetical protein